MEGDIELLSDVEVICTHSWRCRMKACIGGHHVHVVLHVTVSTVEWIKQAGSNSAGGPPLLGPQEGKQFMLDESEHATKQFSESNVIGHGRFGLVYKGLPCDGTVVAVKRRPGLHHLHYLQPPLVHKNFKTVNVLADKNFTAEVLDAGVSKLLERIEEAGPSSRSMGSNVFHDPETGEINFLLQNE
ncbi:hypothetical protein NE237_011621 [Protea cynaroides]|uniref:non-specific serine/threonine protein kinase n=1 Tax=Protea cynaroides TaxID=273540 RepID=A0A9Q0GW05_9MAGN|nr:hypothetical protein NE237_011621 [Protea cynaroides]